MCVTAYIALGANLGDRRANIEAAIEKLKDTPGIESLRPSSLFENPAVGGPEDSPAFLNAVVELTTTLDPEALLDRLLQIERELGRERREKWGPRLIDLDLLLYGEQVIHTDHLTVPHPLMHQRRFVLEPLAELNPHLLHPVLKRSAADLLAMC